MIEWEAAVQSLIDDTSKRELVEANYFDAPLIEAAKRYTHGLEWNAVRGLVGKSNGLAVDIGAGNGIVSFALATDGWQTLAVEPYPSELVGTGAIRRLSRESGLKIDVQEAVGEKLPITSGTVSLVIARQVLHHASDINKFVSEIARILKPGGKLISLRDHVISNSHQLPQFFDKHPLHKLYGGENAFEIQRYRAALNGAGLKIVNELRSFDSIVNYAPKTTSDMRREIAKRFSVAGPLVERVLQISPVMKLSLRLLTIIDRRPGRLVSYVCEKP